MRDIKISTEVFARIWGLRQQGEETEDAILRRVLTQISGGKDESGRGLRVDPGISDQRHGVYFPEGFEVFRTYLGNDYRARVTTGAWVLEGKSDRFRSLNALSRAIGADTENAWMNWYYRDSDGHRGVVSDLRNKNSISPVSAADLGAIPFSSGQVRKVTWRDDIITALQSVGRRGSLNEIYSAVERVRRAAGRTIPEIRKIFESTVRQTLEMHSSDSENYKGGSDIFCMPEGKGAGIWALR